MIRKTFWWINKPLLSSTGTYFIYVFVYYLRLSIKKGPYRFRVGCLNSRSKKNVLESLNDLKFILYLKYDNFSTAWCMTRLHLLPIIYVRAHYIIQLEILSFFLSSGMTRRSFMSAHSYVLRQDSGKNIIYTRTH